MRNYKLYLWLLLGLTSSCTFNFELTSQRTALENQILGSYKELEDDLVLVSTVRGGKISQIASTRQKRAIDARLNQDFNRDDIEELKEAGILGEARNGQITILPKGVGQVAAADKKMLSFAATLVTEENRDRAEIWRRIIDVNENLSEKDLSQVRLTYARLQRDAAASGYWYQDDEERWLQKKKD